ncbi:MAG TPA: DNA-formamidopyrimidine glycosylase [Candidatus Eremiobacteraceae bacterium]|nr:DNA-formamidopyrimidine glycosylase [Candidatus Eremiobacteraceae bacterium]
MPELPEVEAVAHTLRPLVVGKTIQCVHVLHPIAIKPQEPTKLVRDTGLQVIQAVTRRGKYLLLELGRGFLSLHFRFDGHLLWFSGVRELMEKANQPPYKIHVDVAFELDSGVLGFADRRHFGRVHFFESLDVSNGLKSLGVDALSNGFTKQNFAALLAESRRPLKEFLLDQTRVAGIGNIYSCESMWHAKLDPGRRADSLSAIEAARLHKAIVSVLRRALECCLHPAPDFRDPSWWFQGLEQILRAYGLEDHPCERCGKPIRRIKQSGRSTYFCEHCQK